MAEVVCYSVSINRKKQNLLIHCEQIGVMMKKDQSKIGAYLAIGAGVGTALGVSLGNIALGVSLGVAFGLLVGVLVENRKQQQTPSGDE